MENSVDSTQETGSLFEFPALALPRPLKVFGSAFRVELSTSWALGPSTVLKASTGLSMQTLLRHEGLLLPVRQMAYALTGKHCLTATTRKTVLLHAGTHAKTLAAALDGELDLDAYEFEPAWAILSEVVPLHDPGPDFIGLVVAGMATLDRRTADAAALAKASDMTGATRLLEPYFGERELGAWRLAGPHVLLRSAILLEVGLGVLADVEQTLLRRREDQGNVKSTVLELLEPGKKPIGHWLKQVCDAAECESYTELENKLFRGNVRYLRDRAIHLSTLKDWSRMKPGMPMPLEAASALVKVVPQSALPDRLLARFGVARFLAFLCDLLCASDMDGNMAWEPAQAILRSRYAAAFSSGVSASQGAQAECS